MSRVVLLLFLLPVFAEAAINGTDGPFKVFQLLPTNGEQLRSLVHLFETADGEDADFWKAPSRVGSPVDVMISPEFNQRFHQFVNRNNFSAHTLVHDLKKMLVEKEGALFRKTRSRLDWERRLHDDSQLPTLTLGEHHSYGEILAWLQAIERRLRGVATVVTIGNTPEGRQIAAIRFGPATGRPVVVIDGGIHAREWAAVHTANYFITTIVRGYNTDRRITSFIDGLTIYIIPVLNPDGYEFTRTDPTNPRARMWRKNRARQQCQLSQDGSRERCCYGVDLNRNFAFKFSDNGASSFPCSEIYHGPYAFSEQETKQFADFMTSLRPRLKAYITLHAYSQLFIYSYSDQRGSYTPYINDVKSVAADAVKEIGSLYGTQYKYGTGPEVIYSFSGGSTDWASETLGVKYSYTIELRPSYQEWNGFMLPKNQLIPTGRETWAGVAVVLDKVLEEAGTRRVASV